MDQIILDLYQQKRIREVQEEAESARRKAASVDQKISVLEKRCDRMALASQALWELLREKTDLTDEDIENSILEVDMRDGRSDGKMSRSVVKCHSCGRKSNSTRSECLYCGSMISKQNVFEY